MISLDDLNLTPDELQNTRPSRLVVMLYDDAIDALVTAIKAVTSGDIERRCKSVNRAMDVIGHLHLTLDMGRGGQVAHNLSAIYGFILSRLQEINFRNDAGPARQAIDMLLPIRDAWVSIDASQAAHAPDVDDFDSELSRTVIAFEALHAK